MKINIKTCRLLAAGCVALAAVGARAMPTKAELTQAQRQAQDLAAADLHALRMGMKTAGEAAAALLASLPGLWTVGLGKALRRLNRMEELI